MSTPRPPYLIARDVLADWKKVSLYAAPYLKAMFSLSDIKQDYGQDNGKSVVLYFLANATTWRGEVARRIKAELKALAQS